MRLLPHVQGLHKEHAAQGLHIFTFERQGSSADAIQAAVNGRGGAGYSISAGGCNNYNGSGGIPVAWIIGVDGKVIWQGNPGNATFDQTIKAELEKVKYPGLGKLSVHKDVDKAAKAFITGDLAKARDEVTKVIEDEKAEEEAKTDAQFVSDRISSAYQRHLTAAKDLEAKKRYVDAQGEWEWIIARFGTRSEEGTAAKDRLAEYKKDKDIKEEIKADEELSKLRIKLESMATTPLDRRLKEVEKFTKKYEGSAAAARAMTDLAELLK
ncbi:MAG: hypothetical protein AB7K09_09060 [Planctomycetota bacterium]